MRYKTAREKFEKIVKKYSPDYQIKENNNSYQLVFKFIEKERIIQGTLINNSIRLLSSSEMSYVISADNILTILPYELTRDICGIQINMKNGSSIVLK